MKIEHLRATYPPIDLTALQKHLNPAPTPTTQLFSEWTKFLDGGYHTLIHGMTGAGKTTLILTLLKMLHRIGHRILYRDDGGLEFLHLAGKIPMQIWIPEGCTLNVTYKQTLTNPRNIFQPKISTMPKDPAEILDNAYNLDPRFHVLVYDAFCIDPALPAQFYSDLFKELIFRSMQTSRSEKKDLVFSFDELNDLIQPKGHSLTKTHSSLSEILNYNIRKLRKHRVTLIGSTHRFNQLNINVRSQFSYIMIKRSYGKDVLDFMANNLVSVGNDVFWHVVKDTQKMRVQYVYVFDPLNNYDKLSFPDIDRLDYDDQKSGLLEPKDVSSKKWDSQDLFIALKRAEKPPVSYQELADTLGLAKSSVYMRAKKLKAAPNMRGSIQ